MPHITLHPQPWPHPADALRSPLRALWGRLQTWRLRRATSGSLALLDDRGLRDIGLSRDEVRNLLRNLKG